MEQTGDGSLLRERLARVVGKIDKARVYRAKVDGRLAELERDRAALTRALELIGEDVSDLGTGEHEGVHLGPRIRVIDAIMDVVRPGEELAVSTILHRLQGRTDIKINRNSPGSTVSTALSRARGTFQQVRKGFYKRLEDNEKAPPPMNGNGANSLDQILN